MPRCMLMTLKWSKQLSGVTRLRRHSFDTTYAPRMQTYLDWGLGEHGSRGMEGEFSEVGLHSTPKVPVGPPHRDIDFLSLTGRRWVSIICSEEALTQPVADQEHAATVFSLTESIGNSDQIAIYFQPLR